MWANLFRPVVLEPVLVYPGMGGGRRTMWRLTGRGGP